MRNCGFGVRAWAILGSMLATAAQAQTAVVAPVIDEATAPEPVLLRHCLVTPIDDVRVPALRAGLLATLLVREGAHVAKDQPLARFDDREARRLLQSATAQRDAAKLRTDSKLKENEALAIREVADAEHEAAIKANEKFADSVSEFEIRRLDLTKRRAEITRQVTAFERRVALVELGAAEAEVLAANDDIERRQLTAPLEGEVTEIHLHDGEWAEAGKSIMRIVRLDRLRVEGFVKVRDFLPADIVGRPVRVEADLAQGAMHTFTGEITFVSPLVQAGGEYRVWAEVANRRERGHWLLRPGLEARMSIDR
jgi:multidrug efflux pump subunit AcrA (membrane-fusion protein)